MTIMRAPVVWAAAIYSHDYSALTKEQVAECNNWLLDNGLSFLDCVRVGKPLVTDFKGTRRLCAVYTFKEKST
jgi:hypothetical protein